MSGQFFVGIRRYTAEAVRFSIAPGPVEKWGDTKWDQTEPKLIREYFCKVPQRLSKPKAE